ncbi:YfaZ family outer membrane protein [Celerinatantimonas sp. MCCC 1A17872]|uniref:YfaZ family outer membrane protein n=1 Tax=Celerinatantimonas sp. MCCC 1A17872 TaxID=3177514 RepID=UPI0038C015D0
MHKRIMALSIAGAGLLLAGQSAFAATGHANNNINAQVNNKSVAGGIKAMAGENVQFFANGQYSDDSGTIGQLGAEFVGNADPISFGFGGKAVFLDAKDHKNGGVVALGGHVTYQLNDRLSATAETYYAPDILSFHHVDRYMQYGAKASYMAVDNVDVVVGWRRTTFGYSAGPDLRYENNFYLGTDYNF